MPNITRRTLLKQSPAALAVAAVPASAAFAALPAEAAPIENPELIAAYDRFLTARTEVAAAEEALEWLADEWRHRWPLAPVEILWAANADEYTAHAERDIAGRILRRDTTELRSKFGAKWVAETSRVCCTVQQPEMLMNVIARWEVPPTGKTAKALARNRANQTKILSEYRHKLRLSEDYHAETSRLRDASGVEQVKKRITVARAALDRACSDVSHEPARTADGLSLKAAVLLVQDYGMAPFMRTKGGALGAMARFIDATLDVIGRQS